MIDVKGRTMRSHRADAAGAEAMTRGRRFALCIAFATLGTGGSQPARATDPLPSLADQFKEICGAAGENGPALPGEDIAAADAPGFFAADLQRAEQARVVKLGGRYAMRALVPSSADPQHAILLKCAVASSAGFADEVARLSALLSAQPQIGKTGQGFDFAQFITGATSFSVYSEPEGWASIYKMDIMMRNVPKKYLKKGAKPQSLPPIR
ncbi:MAG TPA: hypothetical protein VHM92_08385 [Allosphingosinicella sp.]|nr:hypothetical protein [Allosphingosinicella sp.]